MVLTLGENRVPNCPIALVDPSGGETPPACPLSLSLLRPKIFLISCSFSETLKIFSYDPPLDTFNFMQFLGDICQNWVLAPSPPLRWRPTSGKSWIRHCAYQDAKETARLRGCSLHRIFNVSRIWRLVENLSLVVLDCTFTMYWPRVYSISQWWNLYEKERASPPGQFTALMRSKGQFRDKLIVCVT